MTTIHAPSFPTTRSRSGVRSAAAVLAATGALALAGQLRIPLPWTPVPATLQTFVLFFAAALLGPGRGAAAPTLLWAGGAAGLPLFQGGAAGLAYSLGPTGGYLLAWIPAAAIVGAAAARSGRTLALAMAGASLLVLAVGTIWLAAITGTALATAATAGFLPFLPADAVKVAAAWCGTRAFRGPVRRALD
ncbi:MAG TPA: biotin transporter BioY [Planctomycetota bacterium]|nr:biotin transporter BioY [Planctomycetota bacterium]